MADITFQYKSGLGLTAAYQVSGKPFVTGGLDCTDPTKIEFTNVTSWVAIKNNDSNEPLRLGFSKRGVMGSNYVTIAPMAASARGADARMYDLKVTEVWLSGSSDVDVLAGLTYIETDQINNSSVSPSGTNWSGSLGALVG
jgi:hypothetical protein